MKKITLLLLFLFISISGYSQLAFEGFENTAGIPPGTLPQTWALGTGNWTVFENNTPTTVGSGQSWGINPFAASPIPFEGQQCASVSREQIGSGGTSEDYLVTPSVEIPTNGELHFMTRMFTSGNNGTIYKIMIAPDLPGVDPALASSYTLVKQWTEPELIVPTTNYNVWTEKSVDLSDYSFATLGINVYVAFVRVYTQPDDNLDGDRWLVDAVSINTACEIPTGLTIPTASVTSTTANVAWATPAGSGDYEFEVVPCTGTPTGIPNQPPYTGSSPYTLTGLSPNTNYTVYIRAVCAPSFSSDWSVASPCFTTQVLPPVCGGNLVDSGGTGANYGINENTSVTVTPTPGEVVTVTFTAFNTEAGADILRIYDGPNVLSPLLASLSGTALPTSFTSTAPNGELTFVFTSNGTVNAAGYEANITCAPAPDCRIPTAVTTSALTTTGATLTWTQPANADTTVATVFDLIVLPVGTVPNSGSTPTVDDFTADAGPSYTLTGLASGTCFDVYIRAVCGTNSGWNTVATRVCTLVAPPICGGNYVDSGGTGGNYSNGVTESSLICPTTNADAVTITFTAFNLATGDTMTIYDGDTTGATLLGTFTGTTLPPAFTSTAASGCLLYVFSSNATGTAPGWLANVTCAPKATCTPPIALTSGVVLHNSVVLNWTQQANPDSSTATAWQAIALLTGSVAPGPNPATGIIVNAATNSSFTFTGLAPNTCYDFYVRAICGSSNNSSWNVFPVRNVCTLVAPPECGGNYVDNGGIAGNYTANANVTTVICPTTPGEVVTVTFTAFNTEPTWDGIYVYNGNSAASPQIPSTNPTGSATGPLGALAGAYWGTAIPCPFTSTDASGCLTFVFRSDPSVQNPGFVANITCAPPAPCALPTAVTANTILHNSAILNWTQPANPDASVASAWDIYYVTCGSPAPTAATIPNASTTLAPPYTLTGLNPLTCYDVYVRANCGTSVSQWPCLPINVTTGPIPPVCGGTFVDAGGPAANYGANTNQTTTICPTTPGDVVTVTFSSFNTEANADALYVYNGNSAIPANLIASPNGAGTVPGGLTGGYWGTTIPCEFNSTSADGCLTFVFRSNATVQNAGWVASVTCAPPATCAMPISLTAGTITHNSAVLNWAQPANADASVANAWDIYYVDCGSPAPTAATVPNVSTTVAPPYTLTGLDSVSCYDIYVRANCGTSTSNWTCAPVTITTLVAPPVCGGNFVDSGGPSAVYDDGENITTVICPTTPGETVTVTFTSFNTEATWDGLYVYDGNGIAAPSVLLPSANTDGNGPLAALDGAYWGPLTGANLPGPFTSSSPTGCLTFVFRSDGSGVRDGWLANVTCSPAPQCPKPTTLTSEAITSTSALLGWTELNPNVTQWQVYLVLAGQPAPLPTTTTGWVTVSTNPAQFTGLTPGTQYTFYVRSVCPAGGTSLWSNGATFATLIINDNCDGAIFAPVNSAAVCQQVTPGTLTGATASNPAPIAPCVGTADDDVWFQFVATNSYLNVSVQSITGSTTNLNFAAYSGVCGTLTQIFCSAANAVSGVLNGLTIGNTYYIRIYSNGNTPQTVNFNLCISTPSTCPTASTVCSLTDYANTVGVVPGLGTIGCLNSSPNPAYFTIQVATSGPINYTLTQSSTPGGAPDRDVDYAAWGPFTDQDAACLFIGSAQPYAPPGIGVPVTQLTGCSFSAAPTETLNIANAVAGQYYIILITNFSNQPGFISLTQNNATVPGSGTTNCCPDAFFSYVPASFCKDPSTPNPLPIIQQGSVAGVFSSTITPGLVFVDSGTNSGSLTGQIDIMASAPGNYVVTNTVAATTDPTCVEKIKSYTINITAPSTASFDYDALSFCNVITTPQVPTLTGTGGGSFSASPNGGLAINVATGAITPSGSSPGVYTVTYALPGGVVCIGSNPSRTITIIDAPEPTFTQVAPICPNDPLADLPTSSNDSPPITGTWSPAIDNTQTTTYTFTPTPGQCAVPTTMTIGVGSTTPTFTQVAPICPGAPLADLPTTSNAPDFIVGTWSPALDNTQTTTYTFTPTSGNCVGSVSMTIQVLPLTIVPTFNAVPPICPNGAITPLPTTSNNGITGVWSPALDNTQTTTYTFTPDTGQCALTTTLTIVVNPPLVVTVNNPTFCPGSSGTIVATPAIPGTYTYTWTVPAGVADPGNVASFTTTVPGNYTVVIDQVTTFCNTDFETPTATGNTPNLFNENLVPCWDTTASDGIIELWPPGFESVTAYSGNQLAELNANLVGTLFQEFVVIPGTTISVSFAHRGRQGNDVVGVEIGPVGGPYVSLGNFTDGTTWALHTVNYTIPTGSGNNYTLRFVSVSSTGGSPSIGNLLDSISISALSCTSAPATGVASFETLPAPTVTVTDPTCTLSTGTIEVTSPLNSTNLPTNLFISEVTDANAQSMTYIEIFNGTGAPVDLSNYKLRTFNNGGAAPSTNCDNVLSGILNNNSTIVISVSNSANEGGITPALSFPTCAGVNNNDNIRLSTLADVDIDIWGMTDGTIFTPGGQNGYNYERNNTAVAPSTTFNAADWTIHDPEQYTGVGQFTPASATYEYSLDGGTYQSSTTFTGVATGPHTITVHNLDTGCFSLPFDVTVGPVVGTVPTVTTISYTTPVCQDSATLVLPDTSATGFTSGGTYSEDTAFSTGLVINASTGEVNLASSSVGIHRIKYEVLFDPITCQAADVGTFDIEIRAVTTPTVEFNYTTPICKIAQATLAPNLDANFTPGGTFTFSPAGLVINPTTGVIDLVLSAAGSYTVTYTVAANASTCQDITTDTAPIVITPATDPVVGFQYSSPVCAGDTVNQMPILAAGFVTGGTFGPTPLVDPVTGEVNVSLLTPGAPATVITYTLPINTGLCQNAGSQTATIAKLSPIVIALNGGCQSVYVLEATGSFDPNATFSWENAAGTEVGTDQSLNVPAAGIYTLTVTVDGCSTQSAPFDVASIACQIQKGISVNNDGFNDTFDLTGFDVKQLTIFNRLGMKVFSQANYVNSWGGKSDDGDELPDGTYFYVIDMNAGKTETGWIYINRAQ
ncbi:MAG: fibronectin type III domain-containing protein [Flavobacterium sp. JAD_PAG50586_2]|nr:MAG: fibronectin type III domain-containing protein [Flavobacterium sp. JAD_PAG50586_2]